MVPLFQREFRLCNSESRCAIKSEYESEEIYLPNSEVPQLPNPAGVRLFRVAKGVKVVTNRENSLYF